MLNFQRLQAFVKSKTVWIILTLAFGVGLVFVFMVPPWMHYDEPGHFEYAWLIANKPGLPVRGDYDQTMRRQVAASILEQDFESLTGGMTTDPLEIDQPIEIFLPQVEDHPPTYYLLASLPLRLFRHSDITFQLYLVRLVSLSLVLALVWVGYRTCLELFGAHHPLTWMFPLFLVTLPSFVDTMTAVNNDVAANLAFSLFVWISVLAIKKGLNDFRFAKLMGAIILCILIKSTAWAAAPLGIFVILIAWFRGEKKGKFLWASMGILLILSVGIFISFQQSAPAFYYGIRLQTDPTRVTLDEVPVGDAAIQQAEQGGNFFAMLSNQDRQALTGETVTLGAWIWADQPTSLAFPEIQDAGLWIPPLSSGAGPDRTMLPYPTASDPQWADPRRVIFTSIPIELTTTPQFFAFQTNLPPTKGNIHWIRFPSVSAEGALVYWDGILLVEGDFSSTRPPVFDDSSAETGVWGGTQFDNCIQNASGEKAWPTLSRRFSTIIDIPNRIIPSPSLILSILDFERTAAYYRLAGSRIFRTFWGAFGWGNVTLIGQQPFLFFIVLTSLSLLGLILRMAIKSTGYSWRFSLFFGAAVVLQLMLTVVRGVGSWFWTTYIPVGRYLFPTILPLGILMVGGWEQLLRLGYQHTRIPKLVFYCVFVGLQVGMLLWAILSIWLYYHSY